MSSSKSLFEDVIWALSNRKLGPFKMPLKTGAKMNKYAKNDSSFSLLFALVKHKKQEVNSCDGIYLLSCFYIAFTPMV